MQKALSIVPVRAETAAWTATGQTNKQQLQHALLKGWEPYHMGWKQPWWQSVACPADVDNEQEFREGRGCTCLFAGSSSRQF